MNYEETARGHHRSGYNCSQSVYLSYADALSMSARDALHRSPVPRSEGGKCGAYLAGKALLMQLRPESMDEFTKAFVEKNGSLECKVLRGRKNGSCNDYVGDSARLVNELIKRG